MGAAADRIFSLDKDGSNLAFRKQFLDDSQRPFTDILAPYNNKLYGATYSGGTLNYGIIFEYDPAIKQYTKKYDFKSDEGGSINTAVVSATGILYRFSWSNGSYSLSEYNLTTAVYTNDFNFEQDYPSGIAIGDNGKIYGTCSSGGASDAGYLFEYDPTTKMLKAKVNFDYSNNGVVPAGITLANGKLYGCNLFGGANDGGVLYEYDPSTEVFSKLIDFTAQIGYPFGGIIYRNGKLYGLYGLNEIGIYEYDLVSKSIPDEDIPHKSEHLHDWFTGSHQWGIGYGYQWWRDTKGRIFGV